MYSQVVTILLTYGKARYPQRNS